MKNLLQEHLAESQQHSWNIFPQHARRTNQKNVSLHSFHSLMQGMIDLRIAGSIHYIQKQ